LKIFIYITFVFTFLCRSETGIYAQAKTTVAIKTAENHFTMYKKPQMFINTERGIVTVKGWNHDEIKVTLKLTAKNADADLAQKELGFMKYSITKTYNTVYVNNQMLLIQPNQEISSVIIAEYEIFVPFETNIHIDNRFGKLEIDDVKGYLYGDIHYSDLTLNQKTGNINMFITIGDFNCTKSKLNGSVVTRHSNVSIAETSGKLSMESDYGSFQIAFGKEFLNFSLKSNATEINVENKLCYPMELNLEGSYCPLKISDKCYVPKKTYLKSDKNSDSDQSEWKMNYLPPEKGNILIINAMFGTLNLF
jgi:hypothetical protein